MKVRPRGLILAAIALLGAAHPVTGWAPYFFHRPSTSLLSTCSRSPLHDLGPAATRRNYGAASGARGLKAKDGEEKEVDLEAFRALLSDSWATEKAKSDDGEFDGYKFRDLIVAQWGAAYDVQIKREMWLGKPMIFFNVMWKYLGQQSFHMSEQEYLEHLQALAELVIQWDRVEHLKEEIRKQRKRPNAYFGYAVAIPLNLPGDLMDQLNIPEAQ